MNDHEFLTVKQVSKILQVHWQTVLNYIKVGKLKAVRPTLRCISTYAKRGEYHPSGCGWGLTGR